MAAISFPGTDFLDRDCDDVIESITATRRVERVKPGPSIALVAGVLALTFAAIAAVVAIA
jgi:hypothetical protein